LPFSFVCIATAPANFEPHVFTIAWPLAARAQQPAKVVRLGYRTSAAIPLRFASATGDHCLSGLYGSAADSAIQIAFCLFGSIVGSLPSLARLLSSGRSHECSG
jgi:hypothetical protein